MSSFGFVGVIRGDRFDAGVAHVDAAQAPMPAPRKLQLRDDYSDALLALRTQDPELQAKISVLQSRRFQLNEEIKELLTAEGNRAHEQLIQRCEQIRAEGRKIEQEIAETDAERMRLQQELAQAKNKSERAMGELHRVRQERGALGRFASAAAVKKADDAIKRAEEKLTKAQEAEAIPAQAYNSLTLVKRRELSEKLRAITDEERDLTLAIEGRGGTDSLGFVHPAL